MAKESEMVAVYLHGGIGRDHLWYRVDLPLTTTKAGKRKRPIKKRSLSGPLEKINPVGKMYDSSVGSWAAIGDNIYCIGGFRYEGTKSIFSNDLLKHNIKDSDPTTWDIESPDWNIPRLSPFLAALGTNKLCVVSGFTFFRPNFCGDEDDDDDDDDDSCVDVDVDVGVGVGDGDDDGDDDEDDDDVHVHVHFDDFDDSDEDDESDEDEDEEKEKEKEKVVEEDECDDDDEEKCGGVYDFGTKCWNLLDAKYTDFKKYNNIFVEAAVMSKDGVEEPTQIIFYDLFRGVTRVLDLASSGTSKPPQRLTGFAVSSFSSKDPIPRGLTDSDDVDDLRLAIHNVRALFANGTFYWFSPTMRLYGYDTLTQTWLRSSSLKRRLPNSIFDSEDVQYYPFLLHLPNGKFLLTIQECYGVITMALLTVHKVKDILDVSVDRLLRFECTDHYEYFLPTDGMAVLLNKTK